MGNRRTSSIGLVAAVLLTLLISGGLQAQAEQAAQTRPNIVLISSDDQTVRDMRVMSNLRRLVTNQGTSFANSFAPFPLCCPDQASILTGQYAHNHGVLGNGGGSWPAGGYDLLDGSSTLATWLQDAGYQTAFVGKYLVGYGATSPAVVPPGWEEWHAIVGGNYYNFDLYEDGVRNSYRNVYQTDFYAELSADIITRRAADDAPFFLWTSYKAPHNGGPYEPDDPGPVGTSPAVAERHRDAFDGVPLPRDPSFNEADASDKPLEVSQLPSLTADEQAALTEINQQRWESLLALDEAVDSTIRALQATRELDNTIIAFTSDNGFMMGEHRIPGGKGVPYEPSLRVPLSIRGPGFPAGVVRDQLVAAIDLAPTFLEAAGATAGLVMDGTSLLPLAADPAAGPDRDIVIEAGPRTVDGPMYWTGLRTERFKYVEYGETGEVELYDLLRDPYELRNQQANPAYAPVVAALAADLARLRNCAGAACRN